MSRLDVNRSGELEVFVRVIELGGFSVAAREFGMTPSAVSKLISRLEERLGTRLINRTTRKLQLTPEGCVFYERGTRILADLAETERCAGLHGTPKGRLRINANVPFGHHFLLPLLPEFLSMHAEISLDIVLTDEVVDLLEQRTDIAVRAGPLKDSVLVARKLGETRKVIVGAPSYLARHGIPLTPDDLARHNLLGANYARIERGWPFRAGGAQRLVPITGNTQASDGETLRGLTLAGLGLSRLAVFQVRQDIAAGRLSVLLEDFNPGDKEEFHAVFMGQGGNLPQRVRAFLDFLVERITSL